MVFTSITLKKHQKYSNNEDTEILNVDLRSLECPNSPSTMNNERIFLDRQMHKITDIYVAHKKLFLNEIQQALALSVLNKKQLVGININSNFIILVFIIYKTENTFSFCKINFESSSLSFILFIQLKAFVFILHS